ncbi:het domain-containing protein [Colletotrichum sojae]|uniref:Het domain-containing protein n=1 Tax=Colletotrichum sojae TaxID=2175907 RepID=A0A8H6N0V1_9PEZI|nr:het domain-containing protein [Colletotrichum sojae]
MKLINVKTLAIETVNTENAPRYAILSHTWDGENEITYQEWMANVGDPSPEFLERPAYLKILNACTKAREDGLRHLWADTVCIDKSSSSELSEAINSMFAWYERARVCIVYLADVEWRDDLTQAIHANQASSFGSSRWFTRGWTLQELLAPEKVFFYTKEWTEIGTKTELMFPISHITGIDVTYLVSKRKIWSASTAARMSWASGRQTTRLEDMAYCLLGIFDINMPLLYGEGRKAFLRLQEEIIKASDDHTIFCWSWYPSKTPNQWQSVLAPSPAVFSGSANFVATPRISESAPYQITNVGLSIRLPVVAAVNCLGGMLSVISTDDADPEHRRLMCLPLMKEGNIYRRCPFPCRPFPVLRAMACEVRDMYLLYKLSRNAEDLMPWPYRHQFEYGFYLSILDESFSTDIDCQRVTSVDCLVPQYMQTPSSHVSRPIFSAVGFRSALTQTNAFGGLILRVTHQEDKFLIFLSVSGRESLLSWHCEILDARYAGHGVQEWLREFHDPAFQKRVDLSCSYDSAASQSGNSKMLIALDRETRDEFGRVVKVVYLVFRKANGGPLHMQTVWDNIQHTFNDNARRRIYS